MGAGTGGKKSSIDRDEARKILRILEDNIKDFNRGIGGPTDIQNRGNVTDQQLGGSTFSAARDLGRTTALSYQVINTQYTAFVQSYQSVIDSLRAAVGKHDDKEDTNTGNINTIQVNHSTQPGGQPSTQGTKSFEV